MKKFLLGILLGIIISYSVVYAASTLYNSNEVSYTPSDSSWSVGNVKEAIDNLKSTSGTALTDLKNTSIAKAVSANGNSLSSVINTLGGISNKGDLTKTINPGESVSIPTGYYSGGKITANQNSGTYTPTSRSSSLDMGANNTYRYVNTNSVPNTNSGTYTAYYSGKSVDMGANNTYRYLNVIPLLRNRWVRNNISNTESGYSSTIDMKVNDDNSTQRIFAIMSWNGTYNGFFYPHIYLQASDDGSSWTNLKSWGGDGYSVGSYHKGEDAPSIITLSWDTYPYSNQNYKAYRYYRVYVNGMPNNSSNGTSHLHVELIGVVAVPSGTSW